MRRRLCLVNQPQRQTVTASTGLPGALYGTKYSDANGDGVRNGVLPGATTLNPIVLQQVALPDVPQAFGYYEPGNKKACMRLTSLAASFAATPANSIPATAVILELAVVRAAACWPKLTRMGESHFRESWSQGNGMVGRCLWRSLRTSLGRSLK